MHKIIVAIFIIVPLAFMAREFFLGRKREVYSKGLRISFPIGLLFATIFIIGFYFSEVLFEKVLPPQFEHIILLVGVGFFVTFLVIFFRRASILLLIGALLILSSFIFQSLYKSSSSALAIEFSIVLVIAGVVFSTFGMISMFKIYLNKRRKNNS